MKTSPACLGVLHLIGGLGLLLVACGPASTPAARPAVTTWRHLGTWSGHGGHLQTESFTSDTGGFRVRWRTSHETRPGAGTLKVVFRSGDSGRDIMDAVDAHGVGDGIADVGDRPRWYYLAIDSADLDWTVTVEEPVTGVPRN